MYISVKKISEYPLFTRLFFWRQRQKYGKILDPCLLWARSPWVFTTVAMLYGALDRKSSPLTPALRSIITVRVSQINHCEFCIDINSATLVKRGVTLEKIAELSNWHQSPEFSDIEKTALEYCEAITYSDREVTPEIIAKLKDYFDDDAVIELTGLICFQNLSSKFNAALDVSAQGFCQNPDIKNKDTNI